MCAQWGISTVGAVRAAQGIEEISVEISDDATVIDVIAGDRETDYARVIEYGSSTHAPQPYMRPARDKTRQELPVLIGEARVEARLSDRTLADLIAEKVANRIAEHAREEVPVETGQLRDSIRLKRRE